MSDRTALVETALNAYAGAIWDADAGPLDYRRAMSAAIDIIRAEVLEEAAGVADAIENKLTEQWKAGYKVCDYTQGASDGANDCAAAIRALKGDTCSSS